LKGEKIMAFVLEEWDYTNESDDSKNKIIAHFKKHPRFLILIDYERDESFIIGGDPKNRERDLAQGKILLEVMNRPDFPS
jgi:hypothetical protein